MSISAYDALLNSTAIIEFDVQGHILWANQKFLNLVAYELDEIIGRHHSMFMPEHSQQELDYLEMWALLGQGRSQSGEFKRVDKNQNTIWIQGNYTPIMSPQGEVSKIVKLALDITDKKKLSENLEKKNRELLTTAAKARAATYAKSVFLANMSHEIRTPLNSIIGITDTLAETPLNNQQISFVEILQRANHQLMTIINDVLDLSKVEAGEFHLKSSVFSLRRFLEDIISVLHFRAKEKGLDLRLQVDTDVGPYLYGDSDRLRQVLINLLNNAIKFTHQGGISLRVTLNHTSRPGNILFCIADTGIGIQKNKFKDIFLPFTQADPTTTRRYGGTGLGLSITKNIVELMDGQIWLESEPGAGSVFYFTATMPTADEPVRVLERPSLNPKERSQLKILIVDDVDDNRNLLGIYLQNTNHVVEYAESGEEALRMVGETSYDVIFMDIQMPRMDGHEATRCIRELEHTEGRGPSRIYACTANAFAEDIEKSLEAGCDLHLSKPVRKDTLLRVLYSSPTVNEANP